MTENLYLGDCLEVLKTLRDASVDMVLCDPPYGTTACKWDTVIPFEPLWAELHRVAKPNAAICMFGSEPFSSALRMSNIKRFKYDWVWKKSESVGFLNSKKQPLRNTEIISIFYKSQCTYNPQFSTGKPYKAIQKSGRKTQCYGSQVNVSTINDGTRYPTSIVEFPKDMKNKKYHPTQKPVALLEYLIKTYTNEGETVLDPTMGSSSTGVACLNTGRKFIGIEREQEYFEIAKNRIIATAASN